MARCCSPCDEVQRRGGGYAIHDCLVNPILMIYALKIDTLTVYLLLYVKSNLYTLIFLIFVLSVWLMIYKMVSLKYDWACMGSMSVCRQSWVFFENSDAMNFEFKLKTEYRIGHTIDYISHSSPHKTHSE